MGGGYFMEYPLDIIMKEGKNTLFRNSLWKRFKKFSFCNFFLFKILVGGILNWNTLYNLL